MVCRRTGSGQRDRVINHYGQDCHWCGCKTVLSDGKLNEDPPANMFTVDHLIPISKGGSNEIENLRPACFACNQAKGDKTWELISNNWGEEATPKLADLWPKP